MVLQHRTGPPLHVGRRVSPPPADADVQGQPARAADPDHEGLRRAARARRHPRRRAAPQHTGQPGSARGQHPRLRVRDAGRRDRPYGAAGAPRGGVDCYRAPELWADGGRFHAATLASEQYAIGCLCFELATGTFPFDRTLSTQQFRLAITSTQARTFADVGVRGWPDLETALRPALAADPALRYASMRELADAVAALAQQAAAAEPGRPRRPVRAPAIAQTASELTRKLYPPLASVNYPASPGSRTPGTARPRPSRTERCSPAR